MRADFRCLSSAEGERYVWEQQLDGTPFERHLRSSQGRDRAARGGRGHRGQAHLRADPAGDVAARLADDAPRPGRDPRRGARRDRAGADGRRVSAAMSPSGAPRRDSKWWGWGDPETLPELDRARRGGPARADRRADPDAAAADASRTSRCPPAEPLPAGAGRRGRRGRASSPRPRGPGPPRDRLRLRRPRPAAPRRRSTPLPTPSSCPPTPSRSRRLLEVCAAEGVAVVPFGGGTSVVGGVAPLRGAHERLVSLDLARLRGVEVDRRSLTATLGAGLRGPEAEAALNREGLVLGHFPQSFEYATIGGFAATRSAGQASSGYGRFDALVSSVRLIAPAGELRTLETPHTAAGPALRELIVGSEGALGRDPRRHRPGPPAARRCAATRPGSPRTSRPAPRSSAASPRGPACPT